MRLKGMQYTQVTGIMGLQGTTSVLCISAACTSNQTYMQAELQAAYKLSLSRQSMAVQVNQCCLEPGMLAGSTSAECSHVKLKCGG